MISIFSVAEVCVPKPAKQGKSGQEMEAGTAREAQGVLLEFSEELRGRTGLPLMFVFNV